MTNQEKINKLILKEYEDMKRGKQYIEDVCDAYRFLGHLVFLITNGENGEKSASLTVSEKLM